MRTRILVPLDGSRLAEKVLPCALRLGQDLPADLVLLRAVADSLGARRHARGPEPQSNSSAGADRNTDAHDYLQGTASSLRTANPGVRHVVQYGPAAKAIVDYAARSDVDQIIMATNSYGSLSSWKSASVAERVVRSASVPVLLVLGSSPFSKQAREPRTWHRALVALDGSKRAEQVLESITPTALALGLELILLRVSDAFLFDFSTRAADRMINAYLCRVAEPLRNRGIHVSTAVRTGPVVETIVQFVKKHDVDLIAMSTHARTGVTRWILKSVAAQVLREGNTPVFLARGRQRLSRHWLRGEVPDCQTFVSISPVPS